MARYLFLPCENFSSALSETRGLCHLNKTKAVKHNTHCTEHTDIKHVCSSIQKDQASNARQAFIKDGKKRKK